MMDNDILINLLNIPFQPSEILEGNYKKMNKFKRDKKIYNLTLSIIFKEDDYMQLTKRVKDIQQEISNVLQCNSSFDSNPYKNDLYWYRKQNNKKEELRFHCSLVNFVSRQEEDFEKFKKFITNSKKYTTLKNYLLKTIKINKITCKYGFLYAGDGSIGLQIFFDNKFSSLCQSIKFHVQSIGLRDQTQKTPEVKLYPKTSEISNRGVINLLKFFSKERINEIQYNELKKLIASKNILYFEQLSKNGLKNNKMNICKISLIISDPWLFNDDYELFSI